MSARRRCALDLSGVDPRKLPLVGSRAAREIDEAASTKLGLPTLLLMENAARGVAESAWGLLDRGCALVLCGRGNNGGDGLAAARFLAPSARVALVGEPDPHKTPDAALQREVLGRAGIEVHVGISAEGLDELSEGVDVIVDALLGTGLESAPQGAVAAWIEWINGRSEPVLAVDVPSGLSADSGQAHEPCVHATRTLTFARPKRGLLTRDGPEVAGEVVVLTLGLPEDWVRGLVEP